MSYSKNLYPPFMMSINSNPLTYGNESIFTTFSHDQSEALIHKLNGLKLKLSVGEDVSDEIDTLISMLNLNLIDDSNSAQNVFGYSANLSDPVQALEPGKATRVVIRKEGVRAVRGRRDPLFVSPKIYANPVMHDIDFFEAISESYASSTFGCDSGLKLDYLTDKTLQKRAQDTEMLIAAGSNVRVICKGDEKFEGF
ncbi:hypothetical protein AB6C71_13815 [Vibrio splendidus]